MIDEVVNSLRSDFEEFGVSEEVLGQLQSVSRPPRRLLSLARLLVSS